MVLDSSDMPAVAEAGWRSPRMIVAMDVALVLILSLFADLTAFSFLQGRSVINGDSVQYVTDAEALFQDDASPAFGLRKPGYALFLAAIKVISGRIDWTPVVANHVLLVFFPLIAYTLGRHLHSRLLGWVAAILTMVQLQTALLGDRIMSEVLYTFLMSVGILLFLVGIKRLHAVRWMIGAGTFLGLAWMTRGAVAPVIVVAGLAVVVIYRCDLRKMIQYGAALAIPVAAVMLVECSINKHYCGKFRMSSGTSGSAVWFYRLRGFQGAPWPDTAEADQLLSLIPERHRGQEKVGHTLDQWMARYRAIKNAGMDDWEYDDLCRRVGVQAIADDPLEYLWLSSKGALDHLLRRETDWMDSPVTESRRESPIIHPARITFQDDKRPWYAYWGMPYYSVEDSLALTDRIERDSMNQAPIAQAKLWDNLRYWRKKPVLAELYASLTWLGDIWPGFALLGCSFLGLNRRTCYILAAAFIMEAFLVASVATTTARYMFPWIIFDTTLAAAIPMVIWSVLATRVFAGRRDLLSHEIGSQDANAQ